MQQELAQIAIKLGPSGTPADSEILINGVDVSLLIGAFRLEAQGGQYPTLTVRGMAHGEISGPGIVNVLADREERDSVAAFLDACDPAEVEKLANDRMQWDENDTPYTALVLAVLRELATG